MSALTGIGNAMGNAISNFAQHTAKAASAANGVSFASQSAQGAFNQASVDNANSIGGIRIADQYDYNSAMWDKAAAWNEMMFNRSMEFNAAEAQKQRDFLKEMDSTKYQRAITDMETAGLNPILAVTGGGVSVSGGGGSAASIGAPSMGAASGSLLNGLAASEGNFTGQMEYMSGILGLLSAVMGGFSSAYSALGGLGEFGKGLGETISKAFSQDNIKDNVTEFKKQAEQGFKNQKRSDYTPNYRNGIDWNMKDYSNKSGYYN